MRATQAFVNISMEYFERLPYVERYALFGAFRSDVSNVGPNAAMLSSGGQLTDVGMWYLGRNGSGMAPKQGKARREKVFMNEAALVKRQSLIVLPYAAVSLLVMDLVPAWLVGWLSLIAR